MTGKEREQLAREVMRAVAFWQPAGTSVELLPVDQRNLRESITEVLAPALGFDVGQLDVWRDVARMVA